METSLGRQVDDDAAAAVSTLTQLTADHPFREGFWALLMTALYRLGRQADALAAFQRVRNHLVDELGVEPGLRLRELETRILDQSPSLGDAQMSQSGRDDTTRPGNLPARLDRLIGRESLVRTLAAALSTSAAIRSMTGLTSAAAPPSVSRKSPRSSRGTESRRRGPPHFVRVADVPGWGCGAGAGVE
ncbi:AfsR/SARP family transcriptional regulator [Modestobacter sp. VKM Ac-2983]|uniref:AfsR/SARP family transcriptional regulator n=1 Tax=Modestobacter sp. VKM Ac-2983 TaxID=3004137 RepID=UPI0022AB9A3A|nr:AfsR/SARP family transcriptional regulator [Modestobacter sp. VKM Ac-2983]MCZ2805732.1 AfsR/SARP family transcriptional regulator [Modestobacter sp. VKM Ac-2983]